MNHTSEIKLQVELDENRIPERILWEAPDGDVALQEAKAMFLAVWDHKAKEASRGNETFLLSDPTHNGGHFLQSYSR